MFMPEYNLTWRQRLKLRIRLFFNPIGFKRAVLPRVSAQWPGNIRDILCSNSLKEKDGTQTQGTQGGDSPGAL